VTVVGSTATIGIGSTSNAYGRKYIQTAEPTTDVCDGDVWYDLSGASPFIAGMIMMFSGTAAPAGWAFCDGTNGTPDLRNRFVVASNDMNKTGTTTQAGPLLNRTTGGLGLLSNSTYEPGDIGGESGHQLDIDELAAHNHSLSNQIQGGGSSVGGGGSNTVQTTTGNTGGDKFHENRPPYYALAFIMKI